jgi:Holliday junction resolvase
MSRRGHNRERAVAAVLTADGWIVIRAAGSLGDIDLVALKAGHPIRLIEVKSTAQGPYEHFGPGDRAELILAAEIAGAEAWLAFWPPRGKLQWIPSADWPPVRVRAVRPIVERKAA